MENSNLEPLGAVKRDRKGRGGGIFQGASVLNPYAYCSQPPVTSSIPPSVNPNPPKPKKPSFKLRRSIQPKSVLLLLNEVIGAKTSHFEYFDVPWNERERRAVNRGLNVDEVGVFDCVCHVNGEKYIGDGLNKNDARNSAAEAALQGAIVKKCALNQTDRKPNEDNCPWGVIASLALNKMFTSWQLQGYTVPKDLMTIPSEDRLSVPPTQNSTWMDKNETEKAPLALLNEMCAQSGAKATFELTGEVGPPNDKTFTFKVTINDKHSYTESGKSKKLAKNGVAQIAISFSSAWFTPRKKLAEPQEMEEEEEEGEKQPAMDIDY